MIIVREMFIRSIDMRVAIRTAMIGNSYTMVWKMFVGFIKELMMKSKN